MSPIEKYQGRQKGQTRGIVEWRSSRRGKPAVIARTASISVLLTLMLALGLPPVRGAPAPTPTPGPGVTCPINYGSADDAKPNKLYLYFPSSDDPNFPEFGDTAGHTSPAHRFDASELTSYTGTTADLRDAIFNVVRATYCEFNVQVRQTTTAPPTTFARRNIVAIGSDNPVPASVTTPTPVNDCPFRTTATVPPGLLPLGTAQCVDTEDQVVVDYGRVWAGAYQTLFGGPGGALNGSTNSTLLRWANSIGGSAAHEAGHSYGLAHSPDGLVQAAGEDVVQHHLMATGSHYTGEDRASFRRHFSDTEYSILAKNVGLAIQTMWNWDLVNPNAETGYRLSMDFLSTQPSLIVSSSYTGPLSPWINPTVTGPSGTPTPFQSTTYNRYHIEWSIGQAWSGGPSGQVPGGAGFHVGASFSSVNFSDPNAIIIQNVQLLDSAGNPLAQHPRLIAYDAGAADSTNDRLDVGFFNTQRMALIIRDVVVHELPRVMSLNAMVPGGRMVDSFGHPFQPWPGSTRVALKESRSLRPGEELKVSVARLSQRPHVFFVVNNQTCSSQDRLRGPDTLGCRPGTSTDLFPATTLFLTATVVDPSARFWDRKTRKYVVGTLESHLFYQIAGRRRGRR